MVIYFGLYICMLFKVKLSHSLVCWVSDMGCKSGGFAAISERNVVGPKIRRYRKKLNVDVVELVSRMEFENTLYPLVLSPNHIHKIERKEKPVTDFALLSILEALNRDLSEEEAIKAYHLFEDLL